MAFNLSSTRSHVFLACKISAKTLPNMWNCLEQIEHKKNNISNITKYMDGDEQIRASYCLLKPPIWGEKVHYGCDNHSCLQQYL